MTQGHLQLQCLKAAIALNNVGCELIEQYLYREALRTLRESVNTMKLVFASDSACRDRIPLINARLREASDLLIAGTCDQSQEDGGPILENCAAPIRIKEDSTLLGEDPDISSAIILFNFGIAHLQVDDSSPSTAISLLESALQVFQLSYEVICGKLEGLKTFNSGFCEKSLLACEQILSSLSCILGHLGMPSESEECREQLSVINKFRDRAVNFTVAASAAAAA